MPECGMTDTAAPRRLPVLEGARLRLRAFRDDDADALFAIYSDPRVMRYWSFAAWTERRQAEEKLALIARQVRETDIHPWAIADGQDDGLIGGVTLFAIDRPVQILYREHMRERFPHCQRGVSNRLLLLGQQQDLVDEVAVWLGKLRHDGEVVGAGDRDQGARQVLGGALGVQGAAVADQRR